MVGGDELIYESDAGAPTTDMVETKILINSIISDKSHKARFAIMDLKDMSLHTNMAEPEYMKVHYKYFPQDIHQKCNLQDKVHDGYIYMNI